MLMSNMSFKTSFCIAPTEGSSLFEAPGNSSAGAVQENQQYAEGEHLKLFILTDGTEKIEGEEEKRQTKTD